MNEAIDPAVTATAVHVLSPLQLFEQADLVVRTVMILLLLASAWGWAITADKSLRLFLLNRRARKQIASIAGGLPVNSVPEPFLSGGKHDPLRQLYQAAVDEYLRSADLKQSETQRQSLLDRIHRVAQLSAANTTERLQRRLADLGTIGSVGPFVGLFGTVWGIMNSFQGIAASNNTSLAVVAPGIAEALFATALGLVAAIPSVIFYNRINGAIGRYTKKLTAFTGVFEVELSRHLSRGENDTRPGYSTTSFDARSYASKGGFDGHQHQQ